MNERDGGRRSKSRRVDGSLKRDTLYLRIGTSINQRADAKNTAWGLHKKIKRSGMNAAILMLTWTTSSVPCTRLPYIAKSAFESLAAEAILE